MRVAKQALAAVTLRVDDAFATLMNIEDDGTFIYELRYFCDAPTALRAGASTVRLVIRQQLPAPVPDVFAPVRTSGDIRTLVRNTLTVESQGKDAKRNADVGIAVTAMSDITSTFDNSRARLLATGASSVTVSGTQRAIGLRSVGELKRANVEPPVLQTAVDVGAKPSAGQAKQAALSLVAAGIDPSVIASPSSPTNGTHSAFSGLGISSTGLRNVTDQLGTTPITVAHDVLLTSLHSNAPAQPQARADLSDDTFVPIITDVPARQALNTKLVRIPSDIGLDDFYVSFELLDGTGIVVEAMTKRVAHGVMVKVFNTPKVPPRVGIAPFQFPGKNVIEVEQLDARAKRIRVLRRRIQKSDVLLADTEYEQVTELPLKKGDGLLKFIDIVNNSSTLLYRCIPVGMGGILGSEYTNAVSPAIQFATSGLHPRSTACAINIRTASSGLSITVASLPLGTVAAAIIRRDLTLFEQELTALSIDEPVRVVGPSLANLTFTDKDLKAQHIYEYGCKLFFDDGTEVISTAVALKRYIPLNVGAVDVEISNLEIVRDTSVLDVRFNIISRLSDEGLSLVQRTLGRQNIASLYQDELKQERDRLQQLIAHEVSRIDITTGVEESFGTFTSTAFSDAVVGNRAGVSRLKEGHKYRYVISTLLRDPETLFDQLQKEKQDDSTGKLYRFKPALFQHPLTLNRGTLVTRETLARNHPEDDFAFGNLGNSHEFDVTIDSTTPKIVGVRAVRVDRRTVDVQWSVDGPTERIDHFIVMKEQLGHTRVAGKMHSVSLGRSFEFFDSIGPDDIGDLTYRVIPVMNDFSRGTPGVSGRLRVTDNRSTGGSI